MARSKDATKRAVERHRTRMRRRGLVRIEIQVPKEDVEALREVAKDLRETRGESTSVRETLRDLARRLEPRRSLKELLAAAPLEGVDLERDQDYGRDVDL